MSLGCGTPPSLPREMNIVPVLAKLAERNPERASEIRRLFGREPRAKTNAPAIPIPAPGAPATDLRPALQMRGDAAKGRATFAARCAACHVFAGQGNAVGPALDAARLGGREKLLGNILEPSREITAGYPLGLITTTAGETIAGVLTNETPAGVSLRLPGIGDRIFHRRDIAKIERPARSLMPEGLAAGLTVQDMADLLEFLTTSAR